MCSNSILICSVFCGYLALICVCLSYIIVVPPLLKAVLPRVTLVGVCSFFGGYR